MLTNINIKCAENYSGYIHVTFPWKKKKRLNKKFILDQKHPSKVLPAIMPSHSGRKWKTLKLSRVGQKKWLEICAMFFKDGVEEMMKNASCYIILFFVNI
jgi:hypothetical protein